jgi:hypothetical protein
LQDIFQLNQLQNFNYLFNTPNISTWIINKDKMK